MLRTVSLPTLFGRIVGMAEDHIDLLQLELKYESSVARRTIAVYALIGLCLFFSAILVQLWLGYALTRAGMSLHFIYPLFVVGWAGIGVYAYRRWAKRDPRVGEPFESTRTELKRSMQWIQAHFS